MKNNPEHDRLLDDVMGESAPADFRAELLDHTLRQVRRRNRVRQWGRGTLAAALVLAAGLQLMRNRPPGEERAVSPPPAPLQFVSSQPLTPAMLVHSAAGSVKVISSDASTLAAIETVLSLEGPRELNDEELLNFMDGRPSVLVRQGPHDAQLLIVDAGSRIVSPGAESDQ